MYKYRAKINSVYDWDWSFKATIDLWMNITLNKDIRLYWLDTPEMRWNQKEAWKIVRDLVRKLILDKEVIIETKRDETWKYWRLLANIFIWDINLSRLLLDHWYAKPYLWWKKEIWTKWELNYIINMR